MNIRFGAGAPGSLELGLPSRRMWPVAVMFGLFFLVFAAIEWSTVSRLHWQDGEDVFDLAFFLFQAFWALGWGVGVAILGALTMLAFLFRESAELTSQSLVYVPRLGPVAFPVEYDLARVRNPRIEKDGADAARVLFDYDGRSATLGNAMPLSQGEHIVKILDSSIGHRPSAIVVNRQDVNRQEVNKDRAPTTLDDDDGPWTMADRRWTIFSLIAANLVPVFGVIFLKWSISSLLLLFWVESAAGGAVLRRTLRRLHDDALSVHLRILHQGHRQRWPGRNYRNVSNGLAAPLGIGGHVGRQSRHFFCG